VWRGHSCPRYDSPELCIPMNSFSPTAQGFRLALRRPAITLGEIAWRWSFAAAAVILGWLFLFEYMDTLPVTRGDRLLLITRQPALIARAIHRIFQGSGFRFTEAGVLLALALTVAWIVLASVGRFTIVDSVVEEFGLAQRDRTRGVFSSLLALNFLRTALVLASLTGVIGAVLLASSFWSSTHVSVQDGSRLFSLVVFLVLVAWIALNWLLSLSAIFVVAENRPPLVAVADAVRLCQAEPGAVLTAGILFGVAHVGIFIAASGVGFFTLGALGSVRPALVWFAQLILVAAYCAAADFLYIARLAAYVFMIRREEAEVLFGGAEVPPFVPGASAVDPAELILSDLPLPAN